MDELEQNNYAELCGTLAAPPCCRTKTGRNAFSPSRSRHSGCPGTIDRVNVVVRERLLAEMPLEESARLCVIGDVRSFNNRRGPGAKLVITVFARDISLSDEPYDRNLILLSGTLCKPPNLRTTPMGRDICDLMLAVNRTTAAATICRASPGARAHARPHSGTWARACPSKGGCKAAATSRCWTPAPSSVRRSRCPYSTSAGCRRRTTERTYRPTKRAPQIFLWGAGHSIHFIIPRARTRALRSPARCRPPPCPAHAEHRSDRAHSRPRH